MSIVDLPAATAAVKINLLAAKAVFNSAANFENWALSVGLDPNLLAEQHKN